MATSKNYTFFKDNYVIGDIYNPHEVALAQLSWEIYDEGPYLRHVKYLSNTWPHLRVLADFMEVTTTPIRWISFQKMKRAERELEREERARRTNVTRLDYLKSGDVVPEKYTTPEELRTALEREARENDSDKRQLRLFIVEDLSRQVIELLGAHLDIEPAFFREHIVDYAWYNTRDRWMDPPNLNMVTRQNRWVPLRFVTARHFKDLSSFVKAFKEAESFNVLRRLGDDQNNNSLWDDKGATVGITRTKASFWLSSTDSREKGAVGVLLVDPTIKEGAPLWYGYRNWEATPGINENTPPGPPRDSLYNDLIYWAQRPDAFKKAHSDNSTSNVHVPVQALLHLVCAEWLTMAEYIKTRLGQVEWEISSPEHFLDTHKDVGDGLKKLHVWGRLVPLYRKMLSETLQQVFHFSCHTTNLITSGSGLGSTSMDSASVGAVPSTCQCPLHTTPVKEGPISAFIDEFICAHSLMEEHQERIDFLISGLTSAVAAVSSARVGQRALDDNKNVARLTWLAAFFIPCSFIASLFSMQADLSQLAETFKFYFKVTLPLAIIILALARILASTRIQRFSTRMKDRLIRSVIGFINS